MTPAARRLLAIWPDGDWNPKTCARHRGWTARPLVRLVGLGLLAPDIAGGVYRLTAAGRAARA